MVASRNMKNGGPLVCGSKPGPWQVDPAVDAHLLWSEPKQTGDMINDAMHELLIYHPKVGELSLFCFNWVTFGIGGAAFLFWHILTMINIYHSNHWESPANEFVDYESTPHTS